MKMKGSYTIEAAWIVSISIFTIALAIEVGFEVYQDTVSYVEKSCQQSQIDMVRQFRSVTFGKDIYEKIKD